MNRKIQLLTGETIDQIAAGEVIENPASVIKELVENSLDAKSGFIAIDIKGGGARWIRVADDGNGMGSEDVMLCLKRHATSKLRNIGDLDNVISMGFRGEALASIASISKMSVTSCQKNQKNAIGVTLSCAGGSLKEIQPAARGPGTTIEVSSIFYNVPARKKFQKSDRVSQTEVLKMLTKLALGFPHVGFKLAIDCGQVLLSSPKKEGKEFFHALNQTINDVLGTHFLKEASKIEYEKDQLSLKGYIGMPMQARPNRLGQFLFINGRSVVCPQISYAVYEGYGTRLMEKKHPTFVLHVTLPPDLVDVNVHPQKKEVRLSEHSMIKECVREAVIKGLQGQERSPSVSSFSQIEKSEPVFSPSLPMQFRTTKCVGVPEFSFESDPFSFSVIGIFSPYLLLDGSDLKWSIPNKQKPYDGIVVVDLMAAQMQVFYENFLNRKSEENKLQALLVPLTFEVHSDERAQLLLYLKELKCLGIDIREFGKKMFIIDALAPGLDSNRAKELIFELIEVFHQFSNPGQLEKERKKKLAFTLSLFARSQKKGWSLVEAKHLLKELFKTSSPYFCPKGKRIINHLEKHALSKLFS